MEALAYRESGYVAVEIPGIIDLTDRPAAVATLLAHLASCEEPELVVRLHDPLVTSAALHVLWEIHEAALARGVRLRVVVHPLAVKVFEITGLELLLRPCGQETV